MADWVSTVSGKLKKITDVFSGGKPLAEVLPQMLDPGDPRVVIRPLGGDWLCPYTGRRVVAPDWNGSSLTLLKCQAIKDHLLSQPELQKQGIKAQMKSYEQLVRITVSMRIAEAPNFRFAAPKGEWVCPYCMQKTEVLLKNWDGSDAEMNWFVPEALKHFGQCASYQQDPINGAKPVQEITEAGGDRSKVSNLVANDPRFHLCDPSGAWLCPYSARTVAHLNLKTEPWGPELQQKIVDYVMGPECPGKYSQYNVERSLAELAASANTKPALL